MKITLAFSVTLFASIASASALPDMIRCDRGEYQLVLVNKSPKLPDGLTAIGLKKGNDVVFKVATQSYKDSNGLLSFIETPATATSREAKLDLQSKVANLYKFSAPDLKDGSAFNCRF